MRVDEQTITLAGSPVYYRAASAPGTRASGAQPLYLHGVPTSSDDWVPFLERTGGIAPDLIGFGRSSKAGNLDFTLGGLTDFLERFLDHLEIDRLQLVGQDWGGAVALAFAQRHPERVQRIALLNAVPLVAAPFRWHRAAQALAASAARRARDGRDDQMATGALAAIGQRQPQRLAAGSNRRGLAAVRPGHAARDPEALP